LGFVYVFAQAIGILWALLVNLISATAMTLAHWSVSQSTLLDFNPWSIFLCGVQVYVRFTTFRIGFLIGHGLWKIGWEGYANFPSVLSLVNINAPALKAEPRALLRRTILIVPLRFLLFLNLVVTLCPYAIAFFVTPENQNNHSTNELLTSLGDHTSRFSRICRFTIFIAFVQWGQQFYLLYPNWPDLLEGSRRPRLAKVCQLGLLTLIPLTPLRLIEWSLKASGAVVSLSFIGGFPHYILDLFLLSAWLVLMMGIGECVLANNDQGPEPMLAVEQNKWARIAALFKSAFILPMIGHFCRGFMSPHLGFTYAQNDLIVLTLAYPLLLVLVTFVTDCAVRLCSYARICGAMCSALCLSMILCSLATKGLPPPALVVIVATHIFRQLAKIPSQSKWRSTLTLSPTQHPRSLSPERKIARIALRIGMGVGVWLGLSLLGLSFLSSLQNDKRMFPQLADDIISVTNNSVGNGITIRHAGFLRLDLSAAAVNGTTSRSDQLVDDKDKDLPRYSLCDVPDIAGTSLPISDLALLSLASYFDIKRSTAAVRALLPHRPDLHVDEFTIDDVTADVFWLTIRFGHNECVVSNWSSDTCLANNSTTTAPGGTHATNERLPDHSNASSQLPTLVIVRGTEFWQVSDYLEDIRMWTEPVAQSLLGIVFPTIRLWPPRTAAMVTDTIHAILEGLGVPEGTYKYERLLRHLDNLGRTDKNVVLVGHSLGGGMALVAGALSRRPVVAFSPPGAYMSLSKHLFRHAKERRQQVEAAHHQTISVLAENDWVSQVFDTHGGLVQRITCSTDHMAIVGCHMIENTVCNLLRHCGTEVRSGVSVDHDTLSHSQSPWLSCEFAYDPGHLLTTLMRSGRPMMFALEGLIRGW
jgi:hypothetical protein